MYDFLIKLFLLYMRSYVWHGYYFLRVYIVSLCGQDFLVWE